jgi:hypothetical protein
MATMKTPVKTIAPIKLDLEFDSPEEIKYLATQETFVTFIYDNVLDIISKAADQNLKKVDIIEIINLNYVIELDKNQYKKVLNTILKHYESIENYDKCMDIALIIKKL